MFMLIFSKLDDDSLVHISLYLDSREFIALAESFSQNKKNKVYGQLIDFSKINDNVLLVGDLLVHVYSDLSLSRQSEFYEFISSLFNRFDFHIRRHALTLLTLLVRKEYLSSVQLIDSCDRILQLCSDRNLDIKFQALRFMLNFFPQLNIETKNSLFTLIVSDCQNVLDTDMRAFAKHFLIKNYDHLSDLQKANPFCREIETFSKSMKMPFK
jgi:hypothetical protein